MPKPTTFMDAAGRDVLAYMCFPKEHRASPHPTVEIERRTGVIGIFPDEKAIVRMAGALLPEYHMPLETIAPKGEDPVISLPAVASRSRGPTPSITVTISASNTIPYEGNPRAAK